MISRQENFLLNPGTDETIFSISITLSCTKVQTASHMKIRSFST
jgi:hypothetical protein